MRTKPDTTETRQLGSFTVKSSRLIVSDPTFTEHVGLLREVKRGVWDVDVQLTVRDGKTVVKALTIALQGGKPDLLISVTRFVQSLTGFIGYFDYSLEDGIDNPKLSSEFGGVFKNACLAVSGQGAYQCWYFKDKDGFVVRSTILCVVDYGPEEDFPIGIENNLTDWCPLCYEFHDSAVKCDDVIPAAVTESYDNTEYLVRGSRYEY